MLIIGKLEEYKFHFGHTEEPINLLPVHPLWPFLATQTAYVISPIEESAIKRRKKGEVKEQKNESHDQNLHSKEEKNENENEIIQTKQKI